MLLCLYQLVGIKGRAGNPVNTLSAQSRTNLLVFEFSKNDKKYQVVGINPAFYIHPSPTAYSERYPKNNRSKIPRKALSRTYKEMSLFCRFAIYKYLSTYSKYNTVMDLQ